MEGGSGERNHGVEPSIDASGRYQPRLRTPSIGRKATPHTTAVPGDFVPPSDPSLDPSSWEEVVWQP